VQFVADEQERGPIEIEIALDGAAEPVEIGSVRIAVTAPRPS